MEQSLGPREYVVEPEHVPLFKRRKARITGAVLLVLAVGGGAFAAAQAFSNSAPASSATPPAGVGTSPAGVGRVPTANGTLRGRISSISSDSFSITARGGTESVSVTSTTTYRSSTGTNEHFSDLKVGDFVGIAVVPQHTPYVATTVTVAPAGGLAGRGGFGGRLGADATFGTVERVGTNSFTVEARTRAAAGTPSTSSSLTVKVSASTTYRVQSGTSGGSFSQIKSGETVIVLGPKTGSTVEATSVAILPAGGFGGGGFGGGGFGGGGGQGAGTA